MTFTVTLYDLIVLGIDVGLMIGAFTTGYLIGQRSNES